MISVIVPSYNSGSLLVRNLPKLFGLLGKSELEYEVIVVDDASTDDSVERLASFKRGGLLKVIQKSENTGFGMTVDTGIRAAKGEIVFVLNAIDLLPESSDYFRMMLRHFPEYSEDSDYQKVRKSDESESEKFRQPEFSEGVFSVGALKRDDGDHGCGEIYFEKGYFLHRRKVVTGHSLASPAGRSLVTSAWADGGSQALRREYYLKIGGFDPLYKFYWEDVDLGYRAWKAGYEVHFEPRAVLIHQKAEGPIAKYYSEKQRRIMNLRNQMIFWWKNADLKHLCLGLWWWPYHAAVALKNSDRDWFVANFQVKIKLLEIFSARWRQKLVVKLTDDEVLGRF